jgi:hypothetical protein
MSKGFHVTPHQKGWQVKVEGNKRATVVTRTQSDAIQICKQHAKAHEGEMFIHNKQGKIRERNSYGNDPFPPKG